MQNPDSSRPSAPLYGETMKAMQICHTGDFKGDYDGLRLNTVAIPSPTGTEILIRVEACGVCHTEIDEIENRTAPCQFPMTPGHQVVGIVVSQGECCRKNLIGLRVGVAWIHFACGECGFCIEGLENLCPEFKANGRDCHGGYAEFMIATEDFIFPLPDGISVAHTPPLLCAGAVGYRALHLCGLRDGEVLGLTGFGACGQTLLPMARYLYPASPVFVFARSPVERELALRLGAHWAGDTEDLPPTLVNALIDTTPAWLPVVAGLNVLAPAGRLIINAIGKESGDQAQLQQLDYQRHLWREKSIKTVANVTRNDVSSMLDLAVKIPLRPEIVEYSLEQALQALLAMRSGGVEAAGVLRIHSPPESQS